MIQKPRGTKDLYTKEMQKFNIVTDKMKEIARNYGYDEIMTPAIEKAELFIRSVGDETDIVQKEMYVFKDKSEREIALKPEGTASVIRAYIEEGIFNQGKPTKFMYQMPMYRYEKIQKGRQREFHQFGLELLQVENPLADYEVIKVAMDILKEFGCNDLILKINSIGCDNCRNKYKKELLEYVEKNKDGYCNDCKRRKDTNILRVLDCKIDGCKKINNDAPNINEYLCDECKKHFDELREMLKGEKGIKIEVDKNLVRGLDYYNRTVFEFIDVKSGLTVAGGGRYDKLVEQLGGQKTPAVGFSIGIERMLDIIDDTLVEYSKYQKDIYIVDDGSKEAKKIGNQIAEIYRKNGNIVEQDLLNRSFNSQMKYANKINAKYTIIIGQREIEKGKYKMKNMQTGEEKEYDIFINR